MASKVESILKKIDSRFDVEVKVKRDNEAWLSIDNENLIDTCGSLKDKGFVHLSAISVVDWIKEGKYEVIYHFWSYKDKMLLNLKTRIDREKPAIDSVIPIWDSNAQIHEREMHELFGLKFRGNPDLAPLFLEDWNGPPTFRKDFDWRKYVRENYYDKNNEREAAYYD